MFVAVGIFLIRTRHHFEVGFEPTNADLYTGSVFTVVSEANPGVTYSRVARSRDGSAHTGDLRRRHLASAAIPT